jgi:heme exporter protein A
LPRITIENLSKCFGCLRALDDISLSLEAGQRLAIIGANGAGKSTLLNCVAGISAPQKGRVDFPVNTCIGYLAHKSFLYDEMTAQANLHFWACLSGVENYRTRAAELIEDALLDERAADKVRSLSAGMQKRVALCRAVMNKPDILLLDEPYSAFDQSGMVFLKKVIAQMSQTNGIVIMATHYIEQAVADCTHVALLHRGRLEMFETVERVDIKMLRDALAKQGAKA